MPRRRRTPTVTDQHSAIFCTDVPEQVKPTLNRFAEDTSMLGFRYLHSRYKNWFRILWGFVLTFFVGLTIYQVFERIGYYFIRNPLVTVRTYDNPTSTEFPNIIICPKMQLKASKVAAISPDLLHIMSLVYNDDHTVNISANSLGEFDKLNLLDTYRNAGPTAEDLFLSCQFGKNRPCIDTVTPIVTPNGLCFTISPNASVMRPGPETTLSLLLNLETYEAIPGWVSEAGVILSMYDSTVPATAHFTEGMHLESGKVVTIPINDIRRLSRHSSGCGQSTCGGTFDKAEYARAACHWAVKFEEIQKKCGCRPVNSPMNREALLDKSPSHSIVSAPETPGADYTKAKTNLSLPSRLPRKSFKNWNLPVCNFRQEISCVQKWKNEPMQGKYLEKMQACFQDCKEVSFTTIIFGNELDVNEVSRFLPGDWEEEKEKRLKQFQFAFDNLPKHRIPLVQNIQRLADEAQQFISEAIELFEVSESANESHVPCTMDGEHTTLVRGINRLHNEERIWKNFDSYLEFVFPYHMGSLFKLLRIELDGDLNLHRRKIRDSSPTPTPEASIDDHVKQIDNAIFDLQLIESSMENSKTIFGLKFLNREERTLVVKKIIRMVKLMLDCLQEMRLKPDQFNQQRSKCFHIFEFQYRTLYDARTVSRLLTSNIAVDYEKYTRKLMAVLRKTQYESVPKVFEYKDYDIDLRHFENLYKENGKDHQALVEIMKFRKAIQTDIIENINILTEKLNKVLNARVSFMQDIGMNIQDDANVQQLHKIMSCLNTMIPKIQQLKKSALLRAEWMSRLQREVTIAQSYSPGPQYDKVNLLFLKIYFAHFKQELIVQERSYNLFLLLAEIGGTIGLYVGATLLTVAETIVFFFEKNTRKFQYLIRNDV